MHFAKALSTILKRTILRDTRDGRIWWTWLWLFYFVFRFNSKLPTNFVNKKNFIFYFWIKNSFTYLFIYSTKYKIFENEWEM